MDSGREYPHTKATRDIMTDDHHAQPTPREERLQRRSTEMAVLAGGLAHEIRNPLSIISMNLQLLSEDIPSDGSPQNRRVHQKLDIVRRECDRLESILNDFLQFSRAGELNRIPLDFNRYVEDFLELLRPQTDEKEIELSLHLDPDLSPVEIDPDLFKLVLRNLTRNSIEAVDTGGTIEILTRSSNGHVILEIIDTGQGMDAVTRERIFEAFFSAKPGGSGLGLPTAAKVVEAHGGRIQCESEPGRGTRMTIELPATPPE